MTIDQRDYTRARDRARIGAATYNPKQHRESARSGASRKPSRSLFWYVFAFASGAYTMRWLIFNGFWRW